MRFSMRSSNSASSTSCLSLSSFFMSSTLTKEPCVVCMAMSSSASRASSRLRRSRLGICSRAPVRVDLLEGIGRHRQPRALCPILDEVVPIRRGERLRLACAGVMLNSHRPVDDGRNRTVELVWDLVAAAVEHGPRLRVQRRLVLALMLLDRNIGNINLDGCTLGELLGWERPCRSFARPVLSSLLICGLRRLVVPGLGILELSDQLRLGVGVVVLDALLVGRSLEIGLRVVAVVGLAHFLPPFNRFWAALLMSLPMMLE